MKAAHSTIKYHKTKQKAASPCFEGWGGGGGGELVSVANKHKYHATRISGDKLTSSVIFCGMAGLPCTGW